MGKGNGNIKEWFLPVKKNSVLLELYCRGFNKNYEMVKKACFLSLKKLSVTASYCVKEIL